MEHRWLEEERLFVNVEAEQDGSASGKRYFSRGGVKFALLKLLSKQAMHGYQMMKALEKQSGGLYKPSAGTIYPTLQMLRDQGYIVSAKQEDKQVFSITESGLVLLEKKGHHARTIEPGENQEQLDQGVVIVVDSEQTQTALAGKDSEQKQEATQEKTSESLGLKEQVEQKAEDEHRKGRRLTPVGRELIHLLRAAERSALSDGDKAVQFRFILHQLRNSLYELVEGEGEE
ncbi:PadR family transcriptional regulator [Paenibacillus yanchengensis]|uniref:PadR family transcriptional regulator n=1 Tax=Paenibacillus yanchengensis TaxID=2035833 RepID=A0ABW4YLR8_9BACL